MWTDDPKARLLAQGYREAEHDGTPFFYKPDDRSPLKRRLQVYGDDVVATLHAIRVAMAERSWPNGSLECLFIMFLFGCSERRRWHEGGNGLVLDAARRLLPSCLNQLEAVLADNELRLVPSSIYAESLARELAETLPKNEVVQAAVRRELRQRRAETFDDDALTCGDPNFYIGTNAELRNAATDVVGGNEEADWLSTEPLSATLSRSLNYLEHIKHMPDARRLFNLRSALTAQWRVGQVVLGRDF